ncbi:hypothetical protein LJC25_00385 [Bacteroidales bacterium OttesenSCG-928-K03]|nr:hypothetical protein [Odoribacter sp. OttesenSCG-928-L07]MDL2238796.1 hypothetical protein [Bacteroidales bacterium OttesenSCG-928-L14]MDL2240787.1 hypothetical protein [Bacteroidales bacterium OttesenSCG-928-K22]MDL2242175.1 hypothetical protein [Bacteroidales bacterium OttesenSCG-928-K03]
MKQNGLNFYESEKKQRIESDLYYIVFPSVEKYVLANSGTTQDAQDVFQDALIIFLKKLESNVVFSCKTSTYLFAVAKNLWLQKLANKRRFPQVNSNIACEQTNEYEIYLNQEEKEKIQELYELLIIKCKVNFGKDFMEIVASTNKETRKLRWQYKQKLAKVIKTYPEFKKLKQYIFWINKEPRV